MSKNITLANCGTNITTVVWTVGWHNVTVWVNDSAGNINSSFVNFTIASIPPNISIVYPSNITFSYNTNLNINYTISDDVGISSCWYSNDTFSVNTSLGTTCDNITTLTWNEGVHNVKVYVNDTNSNVVYSSIMFIISNSTKTLNVYLNLTGNVYGWNLLWKKNYSGSWDEFGGVVIENNWSNIYGYTVSKTTSGNITKFDAITGDLIWTTHIGTSDGTPLLDGNNIYINTLQQNSSAKPLADDNNNSGIYKINKTDGTILSENHTCNSLSGGATYANGSSQSITMNDNLIFEGCQNGIIYAYNKNDLTLNWSYVPYIDSSMSILMSPIYQHDRITFGFYNNSGADSPIIQINSTNGSWIWNSSIIGSIWDSQPSSYNDKIYIGFYDGSGEYSLNETNGTTIFNVASLIPNGGYILTQSTIYNDEVLYGEYSVFFHYSNLIIRNASTGIDICSYPNYLDNKHLNGKIVQGPSVAGGIAYFGSVENTTNTVYGINASDCSLIGRLQTNGAVYNPPAIAYGNIYYKDDQYKPALSLAFIL